MMLLDYTLTCYVLCQSTHTLLQQSEAHYWFSIIIIFENIKIPAQFTIHRVYVAALQLHTYRTVKPHNGEC